MRWYNHHEWVTLCDPIVAPLSEGAHDHDADEAHSHSRAGSSPTCAGRSPFGRKVWFPMNITTTFRHMAGTDAVKTYAQDKVAKLQKFLRQPARADVTLSVEGNEHIAEVHLKSGATHLHGSERSEDMYASIDLVIDKLESQIRSVNGARVQRKRRGPKAGELLATTRRS
jgi:putative sigma-54 modulation protein